MNTSNKITVERKDGKIYSHTRERWLIETPEERVRQTYLPILVNEYGYNLDQVSEEQNLTGRGSAQARADFVIWKTVEDKKAGNVPLIVVECKSDNVSIRPADYIQGDLYARMVNARFVVTHNNKETKYWRVRKDKMPGYLEEIENIPSSNASDKEITELLQRLRVFKEDEFADLLHQCHNIIRNYEKKDPIAAFDEIAKLLFIKVWVERRLRRKQQGKNLFTVEFLESQISNNPIQRLFEDTKEEYRDDGIFASDEEINLRPSTVSSIVRLLERYNLSETSEDVKGIAFERFLGRTFRGEMGQFFTPRPIVEFMIRMAKPHEGDVVCDPGSGSGGFLIRFFEIVRQQVLADVDRQYNAYKVLLEVDKGLTVEQRASLLTKKYDELQETVDPFKRGSRLWQLANRCIYGCDANDRMARTSKMNMIMHGDGHGGVHHHDGLVNVNGIFEGRFDIVLTNPSFGLTVEKDQNVLESMVLSTNSQLYREHLNTYGDEYRLAQSRVRSYVDKPIVTMFKLGQSTSGSIKGAKTEILFIERCLNLLRPGGRLGIVLPEGIFNNPTLAYVREFCEDRAFIQAIVSLPDGTFKSSKASVKTSLLFVQKFTIDEQKKFDVERKNAKREIEDKYAPDIEGETAKLTLAIEKARLFKDTEALKAAREALTRYTKAMANLITIEARSLFKGRFNYPVFLYEAEYVGISTTGEQDKNELYPNENQPPNLESTCLERFQQFLDDPSPFLITLDQQASVPNAGSGITLMPPTPRQGAFSIGWKDLERWDTFFYREDFIDLERQLSLIKWESLGELVEFSSRAWKKSDFPDGIFHYIEISSVTKQNGIISSTPTDINNAPSRATTLVKEGDIILSTTRPYLGAFAIVPPEYNNCVCSSGFALITNLKQNELDPDYLLLYLKSAVGLRQVERRMTGGLYPAIVLDELKKVRIPVMPKSIQLQIVAQYREGSVQLIKAREEAEHRFREAETQLDLLLLKVNS